MQPAERKEIIEAMQHEFKTFKEDKIEPMVNTMSEVGNRVIDHAEKIACNTAKISIVKEQATDNKKAILKIALFIAGGLVSIVVAILGYVWS